MIHFRSYKDTDYEAVCDFLTELNYDRSHINWNWARFEWMEGHPEFDRNLITSIGLWSDCGRVVGAAIYDMYFGEAFCGAKEGYEDLYPQILDYAYRYLKDENGLAIAINDRCRQRILSAEKAGFIRLKEFETVMKIRTDSTDEPVLPEGLYFRMMDPAEDIEEFQWLLWQGFDHGSDRNEFLKSLSNTGHMRRHFNKNLSVAVCDQADLPVSYCCMWYKPDTDYAYIEPVCTIPGYRGKGIAKAAVLKALQQVNEYRAETAYVISNSEFYRKAGFVFDSRYTFYRKR